LNWFWYRVRDRDVVSVFHIWIRLPWFTPNIFVIFFQDLTHAKKLSYLHSVHLALTISQTFFLMILTVLSSIDQVFYRMFLNWDLFDSFLIMVVVFCFFTSWNEFLLVLMYIFLIFFDFLC
jgi:hypothetical protein